jgi:hypothetical protein
MTPKACHHSCLVKEKLSLATHYTTNLMEGRYTWENHNLAYFVSNQEHIVFQLQITSNNPKYKEQQFSPHQQNVLTISTLITFML